MKDIEPIFVLGAGLSVKADPGLPEHDRGDNPQLSLLPLVICCKWENELRAQEPLTPKPSVVLLAGIGRGVRTSWQTPTPPLPASPGNCLAMYYKNGIRFPDVVTISLCYRFPASPGCFRLTDSYLKASLL